MLTGERSATSVFHSILTDAAASFPDALGGAGLPAQPGAFRKSYGRVLPRFEAARAGSGARLEIARRLVAALEQHISWQDQSGERPLNEALAEEAAPIPLRNLSFDGPPGWKPSLLYRGERWEARRHALEEINKRKESEQGD